MFLSEVETNTIYRYNGHQFVPYAGDRKRGCVNGERSNALFNSPYGLALSPSGTDLYICDYDNHRIRKISRAVDCEPYDAVLSLSKLLTIATPTGSDNYLLFTHNKSYRKWDLHKSVLLALAPQLKAVKEAIESLDCSASSLDVFFLALHGEPLDRVVTDICSKNTGLSANGAIGDPVTKRAFFFQTVCDAYIIASLSGSDYVQQSCLKELRNYMRVKENVEAEDLFLMIASVARRFSCVSDLLGHSESQNEGRSEIVPADAIGSAAYWCRKLLCKVLHSVFDSHLFSNSNLEIRLDSFAEQLSSVGLHVLGKSWCEEARSIHSRTRSSPNVPTHLSSDLASLPTLQKLLLHLYDSISCRNARQTDDSRNTVGKVVSVRLPPLLHPNFRVECQGHTFWCHDWVMRARWPFFRRVLEFGGAEAQEHLLRLDCLSPDAFGHLLYFIYTNQESFTGTFGHSNDDDAGEKDDDDQESEVLKACNSLLDNAEFLGFFSVHRSAYSSSFSDGRMNDSGDDDNDLHWKGEPGAMQLPTVLDGFEPLVFGILQYIVHNSTAAAPPSTEEAQDGNDAAGGSSPAGLLSHLFWSWSRRYCPQQQQQQC